MYQSICRFQKFCNPHITNLNLKRSFVIFDQQSTPWVALLGSRPGFETETADPLSEPESESVNCRLWFEFQQSSPSPFIHLL